MDNNVGAEGLMTEEGRLCEPHIRCRAAWHFLRSPHATCYTHATSNGTYLLLRLSACAHLRSTSPSRFDNAAASRRAFARHPHRQDDRTAHRQAWHALISA